MHAADPSVRPVAPPPEEPPVAVLLRRDLPASFVVFLVALPLCMGVAQASGVPVAAGLITGIVGGLLVGLIAGSPLQVSGPAAGLTVLVYSFVGEHGLPALGAVVVVAGAVQLVAGLLRLGQWFRAVSPAVVRGMLSGIGVLIFAGQFHLMVDDAPKEGGIANLVTIPQAVRKGLGRPELARPDVREQKAEFLHRFGDLHEEQEEIRELVAERVSDRPSPEEAAFERTTLTPLAERQAELLGRLGQLSDEARASDWATAGSRAARRLPAALDRAASANAAALAALQRGDLGVVRQREQAASATIGGVLTHLKEHEWAAMVGVLTIAVIVGWQWLAPRRLRVVPGPLVAVVAATAFAFALDLPVLYVEVPENLLDGVHLPSLLAVTDVGFGTVLTTGLVIAAVASAETLLCATAVDQMHSGAQTKYDRELAAQGVGNLVCGLLGGLPMTGVIVRSAANVRAGARSRFSAVLHGAWLLVFVAALGPMLRYIPTSCLAGLLVYTGFKLIDFRALRDLRRFGKSEVGIYVATVAGIVAFDLLTGVLIGIGLSGLKLLLTMSRLRTGFGLTDDGGEATLRLDGAATFLRLPKLAAALDRVPPAAALRIDLSGLTYLDHACLELLTTWVKRHLAAGGSVFVDWDRLRPEVRTKSAPAELRRQLESSQAETRATG